MDWLDTETKALLQGLPPEKLAPVDTVGFTLVLLADHGHDRHRLVRAVERAALVSTEEAERILRRPLPMPLKEGLCYSDAQIGQFELICCDAVSVIIRDEVITDGEAGYLANLYAKLQESEEFHSVVIRIDQLRDDARAREFCDRFLGARAPTPIAVKVMQKKARIMQHWATKIGARATIEP